MNREAANAFAEELRPLVRGADIRVVQPEGFGPTQFDVQVECEEWSFRLSMHRGEENGQMRLALPGYVEEPISRADALVFAKNFADGRGYIEIRGNRFMRSVRVTIPLESKMLVTNRGYNGELFTWEEHLGEP